MENKKISSEELEKIQEIKQKSREIAFELGEIEIIKIQLSEKKQSLHKLLIELNQEEKQFSDELLKKYGDCTINPTTGEISQL